MIYDIYGRNISRLSGKKIMAIGDSFVKGDTLQESNTWLYKLASRNDMISVNSGINGASIAYDSSEQYTSIMETYQTDIANNPNMDYVVVLAGHNDSNASIHGESAIPIGTDSDTINTTFKGALNLLIPALLTAYPTAHILFIAPFNRRGTEADYAQAMEEITGKYSVPFFDANKRSTICFQNTAQNSAYGVSNTLHMNDAGHDRFSYIVEKQLLLL